MSVTFMLGILTLVAFCLLFFPKAVRYYLSTKESRTACYGMSDDVALNYVEASLKDMMERSRDEMAVWGKKLADLKVLKIFRADGKKGDGWSTVNIEYANKGSNKPLFTAVIWEDCEIQWITEPE